MNSCNDMKLLIFTVSLACGLGMALLVFNHIENIRFDMFQSDLRGVEVRHPPRPPTPSQEDLELALALFSIDVPAQIAPVRFDAELEDRGMTTGTTLGGASEVLIGPAAFSSWAILGSTLGHEIEVHARQNFLNIVLRDEFSRWMAPLAKFPWDWDVAQANEDVREKGFGASVPNEKPMGSDGGDAIWAFGLTCTSCGTWHAEREAYEYEIAQASRFGLSEHEIELIRQVMDTYYPIYGSD